MNAEIDTHGGGERRAGHRAAFYCVCSGIYFLAAVGLVNSLRRVGHEEPIFVLDCGLTPEQRKLLAPHVILVQGPGDREPLMSKTVAPAKYPAEVMVLIDADVIVTRPLTDLIETAARGNVIGCATGLERFVPEWGELLDLGTAQRRPHVSSCFVLLGGSLGSEVLHLVDRHLDDVDLDLTYLRRDVADYPFWVADEDVLNAVIATRVDASRLVTLEGRMAAYPPFTGLRVIDERSLRCSFDDGVEPYLVHHWNAKPWLEPTHHGVYSRLLRRSLVGPDLTVRLPEDQLPRRLQTGALAYLARKRVNARERFRWQVSDPLSSRVRSWRGRVTSRQH